MRITRRQLIRLIKEELTVIREGARPVNIGNLKGGTYNWYVWPMSPGGSLIGDIKSSVEFRREVARAMENQSDYGNLPEGYALPNDFHVSTNVRNDAVNNFIEMYVIPDLAVYNGLNDPNTIEAGKLLVWPGIYEQVWWPMWGFDQQAVKRLPGQVENIESAKIKYHEVVQRQTTRDAAKKEQSR